MSVYGYVFMCVCVFKCVCVCVSFGECLCLFGGLGDFWDVCVSRGGGGGPCGVCMFV